MKAYWIKLIRSGKLAWVLAVISFAISMGDIYIWRVFGVEMTIAGETVTLYVTLFFALNFAIMGYMIGRLTTAKYHLRKSSETIKSQLQALEISTERALENEKLAAIGRLSAGVAHEVRNPLGVIRAAASLLQDELENSGEAAQASKFICEEVDRLNGFVTSLLDFSKPVEVIPTPVAIAGVFDAAKTLVRDRYYKEGINLESDDVPLEYTLLGDKRQLTQLVLCLLTNAQQALDGPGEVHIRCYQNAKTLSIEVADSGPGVSEVNQKQLFEPFFTTKSYGTGLGLAMAARITRLHHGTLSYRADKGAGPGGEGACFELVLPSNLQSSAPMTMER